MNTLNAAITQCILTGLVLLAALSLSLAALKNRTGKGAFLCDDCRFNDPEKCLKTVRPYAVECTSYRPVKLIKPDLKNEISQ